MHSQKITVSTVYWKPLKRLILYLALPDHLAEARCE